IVTNWKNVLDLKYLLDKSPIGLPIVGIGMGHFMGNNHIAKEIVIPGLNIQAPYQSLMKGYSTEPGAVWLFVPVNKPTEIKDGQGNSYKPVKLLTKAFENEEWGDRAPNSLLSRLARLFNKVLKGEIKISQQGVNDFSFVDESVERFKSLKNEGNKGTYLAFLKTTNAPIYTEYLAQAINPSDFEFMEYLEIKNPIITDNKKYASLY